MRRPTLVLLAVTLSASWLATPHASCQPPAPAGEQSRSETSARFDALEDQAREQSEAQRKLTARFDAVDESLHAAARASEAAARNADLVIKLVGCAGGLVVVALAVLGFLGYRDIGKVRALLREAEVSTSRVQGLCEEIEKRAAEVKEAGDQVAQAVSDLAEVAKGAGEYVARIEAFHSRAAERVRELAGMDVTKDVPEEVKKNLQDVARRIELVEALGLPLDVDSYLTRASDFYTRGDYEQALLACERAIDINPKDSRAHYNRGVILHTLGRYDEALAALERVLELNESNAMAHTNKGFVLLKLSRPEDALVACSRAVELKPDLATAHYNKACAYAMLNRRDETLEALRQAIELDSKYREMARTDDDLAGLRDDPEFRKLVGLDE